MGIRLGDGIGGVDRYLFGPNVSWQITRPPASTDPDRELVSRATQIFCWSTRSPYDFIIRIHHLFIEVALPVLLLGHAQSGTYADKVGFAHQLQSSLLRRGRDTRWTDATIEQLLRKSGSADGFLKDPALIFNRLRTIRNNVIHADPSVEACCGVERWGGVYLRYFETLLEELRLVSFA